MGCQGSKETISSIERLEKILREERTKNKKQKEDLDQITKDFGKLREQVKISEARRNEYTSSDPPVKSIEMTNIELMLEHTLEEKSRLESRLLKEQHDRAQLEQKLKQLSA